MQVILVNKLKTSSYFKKKKKKKSCIENSTKKMFSREGEQDHTVSNEKGLEVLGDCGRQKLFDVISEFYQYTDLLLGTRKPNSAQVCGAVKPTSRIEVEPRNVC